MVSLHKALSQTPKTEAPSGFQASQNKRKWDENPLTGEVLFKDHKDHAEKRKSIFDIELHLKTPLPSDKLQQYLSLQSGKIHLCNNTMNMKTPDSERDKELGQMSLDLELNLTCTESLSKKEDTSYDTSEKKDLGELDLLNESNKHKKDSSCVLSTPSWLSSDIGDYKEMIATVCMRCHMLVMLCTSSPSCPNCKFMHPPDQNPSKFLKRRRFSLFC